MKIGIESHKYEVQDNWGVLPEDVKFGYTHGVVTDAQERIYIFNMSKNAVVVFDKDGRYLKSWGKEYEKGAHGMLLHKEGDQEFLYLTDINRGVVVKTTLDGEVLLTLGTPDLPDMYNTENKYAPTDVAVAPNGDIYTADGYGQNWIHQYNAKGKYLRSWGGEGTVSGKLSCPHGISVDKRGSEPVIYVADRRNKRIQVFTLDGKYLRMVTEEINAVCNFYQYKDELYFPDLESRVTILNKNDKLIAHIGVGDGYKRKGWPNHPKKDLIPGVFNSPHGILVDPKGNIFLVEWIQCGRVTKLKRID
ncbi:MAG: hypothetical protein WD607_11190 [Candidatus Paceibacterota bacterium]